VAGYATANSWGVAAPRATSPQLTARLNTEMNCGSRNAEVEKRLINEGAEPSVKTPEELGKHVPSEMEKWVKFAKITAIHGE
jgi:tripartite-type tricarboxylate transporter receptor subunit TctC